MLEQNIPKLFIAEFFHDIQPLMDESVRYFIVTPGRTGSTFLAAILAKAGADFGMDGPSDWSRDQGGWENRLATRAARYATEARRIGYWSPVGPLRLLWRWHMKRASRDLNRALRRADFIKVVPAQHLPERAADLGYVPRIILSVREFSAFAASMARYDQRRQFVDLRREWLNSVHDGALLLQAFGGCVVDYEELTNLNATNWAERLAHTTGFNSTTLLEARGELVKDRRDSPSPVLADEDCDALYLLIKKHLIKDFDPRSATDSD